MSNLLKSSVVIKKDETRVIDSNSLIASRLQELNELIERGMDTPATEDDFEPGFTSGLNAQQLELLLEDNPDREFEDEEYVPDENSEILLASANAEAERIVLEARNQAEEIINEANATVDAIRQEATEAGHSEGYEAGYAEGLRIIDEKNAELEAKEQEMLENYDRMLSDMEPLLVEAITDIYEHIFHVSLSSNREILLNLLHDTVRNIEGGKNFIVHVSKNDYEYINERKDQLTEGLGSTDTIEVIEDLTLYKSECFIEAEGGIYDCGIGTEMELLKKELKLLAYQKN